MCSNKAKQTLSYKASHIAMRYAKGRLWMDLVTLLPWNSTGLILSHPAGATTWLKLLHLIRLLKLMNLRSKSKVRVDAACAIFCT